ncbi:ComEC/Rec2 family competence protein [Gemmata sp. JC717]|uniref:ComEC/Rec2 family competence protein n=1 Tax=Gemmata algarum TaxID=2975278 RepID=UPI0021BA6BA3|nr:ComEC/Rec2 family competence protein [Gemmata algarum]MDY3553782.1 ComEC/Rec2 family competence protein [Gemmata algarum]
MPAPSPAPDDEPAKPPSPPWREFARSPLVPFALAASAGLLADRYIGVPLGAALIVAAVALVGWFFTRRATPQTALGWLLVCAAALAAAHHHAHRHTFAPDDVSTLAKDAPEVVRVRGTLAEEPDRFRPPRFDPLLTMQREATSTTVLEISEVDGATGWRSASGRVRLSVEGRLDDLHCGDAVQVVGRLSLPEGPANPGERDYRGLLLDKRITADLRVKRSADPVVRIEEGWRASLFGWLAVLRGWGTRALAQALPKDEAGLATALLLGDSTALDREEWDAYVRTGVIHVLAISGQHLVILGAFAWAVLRLCGFRNRHSAWAVALLLLGYALLTGARPSAMRAAVMVCAICGGIVLRRRVILANVLAFAWLVVIALNPTDPFTAGCQLSFLCVFVLLFGAVRWLKPRDLTPIEQLIDETRGPTERAARAALRWAWNLFAVGFILTAVNVPLVLAWQNVASPVAVLIGPPLVVLTGVALIAGFVLLVVSPLGVWAAWPFARVTEACLAGCEWIVHLADRVPGGHVYAPGPPMWWLVGFYVLVAGLVLLDGRRSRQLFVALVVFSTFGAVLGLAPRASDEMRVTFLAVGHGGCVVVEAPDGRVLLYDTGTTAGPDAVRRVVAPYLWSRGVTRIDEVFLSHADLDHFNGVPELFRRFHIAQVTMTPTFPDKNSPGVEAVLAALDRHNVPRGFATAGQRFVAGDVALEVLHPPPGGLEGNENVRSLVLLVRHGAHTVLLTGDLEGEGQARVTARPVPPVDVMLAPHHGAKSANAPRGVAGAPEPGAMAAWARPKLVVSSQRAGTATEHLHRSYRGATVWDTPSAGAVTVRSHRTGLVADAFRSGERQVIER